MLLKNKNIILAISGSIAAYKTPYIVRFLTKIGANVKVIATRSGEKFVAPIVFEALSNNQFIGESNNNTSEGAMAHINLAKWADIILIAPATANIIAKFACGLADDIISSTCLASKAIIFVAPAMNKFMWEQDATQNNINILKKRNFNILYPSSGLQACGDEGYGVMLDPKEIIENITHYLNNSNILAEKKILITSGPTYEPIDPVRFLGNRSSGKMGYAIANAAQNSGAKVSFISGPVNKYPSGCTLIKVNTAIEMHNAVKAKVRENDIFISCAAVADYRPKDVMSTKIKKNTSWNKIELEHNCDILQEISIKFPKKFIVGFAAETENLENNALNKLKRKKLDMIVANTVSENEGFNKDYSDVLIIDKSGKKVNINGKTKDFIAAELMKYIAKRAL